MEAALRHYLKSSTLKPKQKKRKKTVLKSLKDLATAVISNLVESDISKTSSSAIFKESNRDAIVQPVPIRRGFNPFSPTSFNVKECGMTGIDEFDKQITDEPKLTTKQTSISLTSSGTLKIPSITTKAKKK